MGHPTIGTDAVPGTGIEVFADVAEALAGGFGGIGRIQLYGFAHHQVETTFLATSTGLRRRYTQPTGSVEINAKRGGASRLGRGRHADFVDVPTDCAARRAGPRLGWAAHRRAAAGPLRDDDAAVDGGRHDDLPGVVDGRARRPGGPHRAVARPAVPGWGRTVTGLPLTLSSDPAAPGLECAPFVAAAASTETVSVFDNGIDIERVDWIRDGAVNALAYPRAAAAEFGAPVAVPATTC